uniref:Uncharacterized protein n=1 Tax=Triticum urartu TaxID=4572 RepID=A0A8R7UMU1_TRIUA
MKNKEHSMIRDCQRVAFKRQLTFDELLNGGGRTPWGTVFQERSRRWLEIRQSNVKHDCADVWVLAWW